MLATMRSLKPSTYRLQIFLVRDQYLRSLLPHRDQTIAGQLEKHVFKNMLAILTTYMEFRLKFNFPDTCLGHRRCLRHSPTKCLHILRKCPRLGRRLVWNIVADHSSHMDTLTRLCRGYLFGKINFKIKCLMHIPRGYCHIRSSGRGAWTWPQFWRQILG